MATIVKCGGVLLLLCSLASSPYLSEGNALKTCLKSNTTLPCLKHVSETQQFSQGQNISATVIFALPLAELQSIRYKDLKAFVGIHTPSILIEGLESARPKLCKTLVC